MTDALIIDACRTPRGVGKAGKGALAGIHPQQLGATVLRALAERNGIEHRRGRRHRLGLQRAGRQRRAAISAACRRSTPATTCAPARVTLDRFCGSGITSVNMAAASIMSGTEDLVIAGGMRDDVDEGRRGERPDDDGRRQSAPARAAPAVASGRLRRRDRDAGRHHARGRRRARPREPEARRRRRSQDGHFKKSLVPVQTRTAASRSTTKSIRGRRPRWKGSPRSKPAFPAIADYAARRQGHDLSRA